MIESSDMDIDSKDPKPLIKSTGTAFSLRVRENRWGSEDVPGKEDKHVTELEPPSEEEYDYDKDYEYDAKGEKMTDEEKLERNRSVIFVNSLD
jgi:hypothetical protein